MCAALLAPPAVAAGAVAAYALRGMLPPPRLARIDTAARYQMSHALGAAAIGLCGWPRGKLASAAGWLMVGGAVLFPGSLYLIAAGAGRAIRWVTPLGGVAFMAGWLALAVAAWRAR